MFSAPLGRLDFGEAFPSNDSTPCHLYLRIKNGLAISSPVGLMFHQTPHVYLSNLEHCQNAGSEPQSPQPYRCMRLFLSSKCTIDSHTQTCARAIVKATHAPPVQSQHLTDMDYQDCQLATHTHTHPPQEQMIWATKLQRDSVSQVQGNAAQKTSGDLGT